MPLVKTYPKAGEHKEQKDRFLVLGSRGITHLLVLLGCFPTLEEAEKSARRQINDPQYKNAFVVPANLTCTLE